LVLLVQLAAGHVTDKDGVYALNAGVGHGGAAGSHSQLAERQIPMLAHGRLTYS
jgi:hypothetical protein